MSFKIALLPGDGIGPEVVEQATRVLNWIDERDQEIELKIQTYPVGGASIEKNDVPLTQDVLDSVMDSDAILLGAVGGPQWDDLPVEKRPEKALLRLRKECELYANLRPIKVYPELVESSPLKNSIAEEADLVIVRELTGGIYFSDPRGTEELSEGRRGFNTLSYTTDEIERITEVAIESARNRSEQITSVDKANVLESSQVWRDCVENVVPGDIRLNHLYVDNAAMQLIRDPNQFEVIVTGNLFGDILSDAAAQISGSIGLLPSASLGKTSPGMYEPVHGSAPDIAGNGLANPVATILSVALLLRYSLNEYEWATHIESAVESVIKDGLRTADIASETDEALSTSEMGDEIVDQLSSDVRSVQQV